MVHDFHGIRRVPPATSRRKPQPREALNQSESGFNGWGIVFCYQVWHYNIGYVCMYIYMDIYIYGILRFLLLVFTSPFFATQKKAAFCRSSLARGESLGLRHGDKPWNDGRTSPFWIEKYRYPLVMTNIAMERSTIYSRQINYRL